MTQNKTTKGLAALALTVIVAGYSHAAFTSVTKNTFSAGAILSGAGTVSMTTSVKDRVSNAGAASLTWSSHVAPAPGAGFLLADQYIQLNTVMTTSTGGGVQIYTDNTNVAASPKFTGDKTQATPAGLIGSADTTKKLPTAWEAVQSTSVVTASADPGTIAGSVWLYHEDAAQVAILSQNAAAFANADDFITVYKANAGVHFAQGPTQFGGFHSTDTSYIYTEADFSGATTPNTYATNELIVEAFTL
jgi:hypothetical protein